MAEVYPDSMNAAITETLRALHGRDSLASTSFVENTLEARYMGMFLNMADDYGLKWLRAVTEEELDLRRSIQWHTSDALKSVAVSAVQGQQEENVGLVERIRDLFSGV